MAMASWQSQSPTTGAGLNSKLQKKSKVMGAILVYIFGSTVDVCGWMDGRKATVEPPAPGAGVALLDRHNFVVRGRRLCLQGATSAWIAQCMALFHCLVDCRCESLLLYLFLGLVIIASLAL